MEIFYTCLGINLNKNDWVRRRLKIVFLTPVVFFCFIAGMAGQSIFTVNSTDDFPDVDLTDGICADKKGNCTLRAAIESANQTTGVEEIHFNLRGKAPFIFSLTNSLPSITEQIVLDATTQNGYSWSSPAIIVDGGGIVPTGFKLEGQSSGSIIRGFVMGNFSLMTPENILTNGTAIYANGTGSHQVTGNFLGITSNGNSALSNTFGVALVNSSGNTIGGDQVDERNVISGNYIEEGWGIGIYIYGKDSFDNKILGNFIGTDPTGTRAIPNYFGIVTHEGANKILIGGDTDQERNIISGNIRTGVYVLSPNNVISGNFIGLGVDGKMLTDLAESRQQGVRLWTSAASGNIIGGLNPGEGNVISGNISFNAITVGAPLEDPIVGNKVLGNYIGTDPSGQWSIPNYRGISITAQSTSIANNVISGNETFGLSIHASKEIMVSNNLIGTKSDGKSPLGNGENGIMIVNGSENNRIGSSSIGQGNTIAYNMGAGILVSHFDNIGSQVTTQPSKNSLLENRIFGNSTMGIDLDSNGLTENDLNDEDEGANRLQNFPVIEQASLLDQVLELQYSISSEPVYSSYPISAEFYKSDGTRQGIEFLGSDVYTKEDFNVKALKNVTIPLSADAGLVSGDFIIATATDADGNTSEFSLEVEVEGDCNPKIWYLDADNDTYGIDAEESNISSCTKPEGNYTAQSGDCNDSDASINPGAEDIPNDGIDQDCDGADTINLTPDSDMDGIVDAEDNCPDVPNPDQADTNANGIGDACENAACSGTDSLIITDCTSDSTIYWTISNEGSCSTTGRWEVRKSNESGTFTLGAREVTTFTTQLASKGQTQVSVYWLDSTGSETRSTLNASGNLCSTTSSASTEKTEFSSLESGDSIEVYPNPIMEDGFYISFSQNYEGKSFNAEIYDLYGRFLASTILEVPVGGSDILWNLDHSSWEQGIYQLILRSGNEEFSISLMKN